MTGEDFRRSVGGKIARRLRGMREGRDGHWYWLGMFGLVGWSVMIPTVLGIVLGVLADRTWGGQTSWTLTGLIVGLALGCATAWYWVRHESRKER